MKKCTPVFFSLALAAILLVFTGCRNPAGSGPEPGSTPPPPSPTTYTVSYDGNSNTGGAVPVDSTAYTSGAAATVLGNTGTLAKTGNEFVGWNTAADGTGTTYHPGASITVIADITLYARWTTAATYTITYDGNGDDSSGTVPVDTNKYITGDVVTVLGNSGSLVKALYTFMRWDTQPDGLGAPYSADDTITVASSDITLYAKWSLATALHVTYNKNSYLGTGTVPVDDTDYAPNASVTVLAGSTLTRSGYIFDGWTTSTYGGTTYQPGATFPITANTALMPSGQQSIQSPITKITAMQPVLFLLTPRYTGQGKR
jgi:hypothetical protein